MAAELVGTAYVRIRAITTGLAKDISDGVDKGVKDAGPDVSKSGETLGDDLGDGTSKGFTKSFKGTVSDGVKDEIDSPDLHRAAERGGGSIAKDVTSGIEDEHKRRNPFRSLVDAFKNIRRDKGAFDLDVDFGIPDIDLPNLFKGLGDDAEKGGEELGGRVGDGIDKGIKKRGPFASLGKAFADFEIPKPIEWAGIFGPTTLAPIIGTITSLLGLLVEMLGFVVTAAAGAGVALAGIAAVAIPGIGVLLAAFKTDTAALKKFKEEVKNFLEPWKQVGEATQKTLLPGLKEALRTILGNGGLLDTFKKFGETLGQGIGDQAHYAAATLLSQKNMDALNTILRNSVDFFHNMGEAAISVLDVLLPFFSAVAPLAVDFSESVATAARHLQEFMNQEGQTEKLTTTFKTWYDNFVLLAGIIGNVFVGLWNILQIASVSGTPFFDKLAEGARTFAAWTKSAEGQNTIKKFFDDIQPVLDELWRLLGNVIDLIVTPATGDGGAQMFSNLAAALDLLNDVLENPITAQVVPYLLSLIVAVGLLNTLHLDGPIFTVLGSTLDGITWIVKKLALAILTDLIPALASLLLTNPVGWVLLAIAAGAVAVYLAFQNWDVVTGALKSAWEWFTNLETPLKIVVGLLTALTLAVVPIVAPLLLFAGAVLAVTAAIKHWDEILDVVNNVKDAIVAFATTVPDMLRALPGQLLALGTSILNFFRDLPDQIGDALSQLGEIMRVAILDAVRNAPTWILDGLDAMYQAGQDILGFIADGLAFALPKLAEFFIQLPFFILEALGSIASTLLPIGLKIIDFIVTGLVTAGPKILAFFIKLPFEIATLLRKAAVALMIAFGQGILDNKGRILDFFINLPGNIISAIGTALTWLVQVGWDIIQGLWQGITNNWDKVLSFFIDLPGNILSALSGLGGWLVDIGAQLMNGLWDGIQSVWASISEYFFGLPQNILTALGDLFTFIWNGVTAGASGFLTNIDNWIISIITSLATLPVKALSAIGDIGMTIWNAVTGGFSTAATNVAKWVTDRLTDLGNFARDAPGKVASLVTSLPAKIGEATLAALAKITQWVTDGLNALAGFATDAVTKVAGLVTSLPSKIGEATKAALKKVTDFVDDALAAIKGFIDDIPKKLANAAGTLASGIGGAIKKAWNAAVDRLPTMKSPEIFGHSITISADFLKLAQGGVVPGSPFGSLAVIGEGGRTEAVVPTTRPARALAVMREAGLDKLVLQAALKDDVTVNGKLPGGDVTMLHMDHATFVAPIDADVVIAKISSAYRRMAS